MAKDFGRHDTKQMLESLIKNTDQRDERAIISLILESIESYGWGEHKVETFDLLEGVITFTVTDNPTIDLCNTDDSPQCYFMKGVLSGIIKEVTEIDFLPLSHTCKKGKNTCTLSFTRQ
jgi:predicted hydrocarbon binding protein